MFPNATVSSRSSSSRSGQSCGRNSSMPSLRMPNPLYPKTSFNPLFNRHSDAFTSFDASHFVFQESKRLKQKKHPFLRRYNSHDSHPNFDEIGVNSKNNTPDSTKSRSGCRTTPEISSPESTGERDRRPELFPRDFLERYSLPRVVRIVDGASHPLLLYRCFDSFTKVEARGVAGKKGKEKADFNTLHFPEGYSGWFSLINEKGEKCATAHSSILQLVREQVCSFISVQSFTAYTASNQDLSNAMNGKTQYLKTQIRGGQVFQLRAVFQHQDKLEGERKHSSTRSSRISRNARDKDLANRYAQLISQNNQELYVPLTTKGEFFEIYTSMKAKLCFAGMIEKTGPLALDKDCLYKMNQLLQRVALPVKVKLVSGPLPSGLPKEFTDTFILEKKFQEPLMVTCTLPAPNENSKHQLGSVNMNSKIKLSKCTLGFDSENRLFKSQRVQMALAFCHKNVETWYREVKLVPNIEQQIELKIVGSEYCINCKRLSKVCGQRCSIDVKNEDDFRIDENSPKQLITKEMVEKFHKPKKWYLKILGGGENHLGKFQNMRDPMEGMEKVRSIERYKDMSKLIEEKFGKKSYNPVKKSASFMYSAKRPELEETSENPDDNNPTSLKCESLEAQHYSNEFEQKLPDLPKKKWDRRTSCASDSLSNSEFQMCILDNETGLIDKPKGNLTTTDSAKDLTSSNLQLMKIDFDEIKPIEGHLKLKKNKPDLIPTLTKKENSFITDRLCSEFHVKTKIQKPNFHKQMGSDDNIRNSIRDTNLLVNFKESDIRNSKRVHTRSVIVQVHEESLTKTKMLQRKSLNNPEDIPYSHVVDDIEKNKPEENIYAEICENPCNCKNLRKCKCKRTNEYCYVKLGSNGDSVTQSDSDEAIYNTLR